MRVLFISHDASRTGAPILLLNLALVLIRQNIRVDFLLKNGGPLEKDFNSLGEVQVINKPKKRSLFRRIKGKLNKPDQLDLSYIDWESYNCVLSNTITNGDILPKIREHYSGPIYSYIHELEMAASFFTNPFDVNNLILSSDYFLVPSNAVKKFLTDGCHIQSEKIYLLPYYIPTNEVKQREASSLKEGLVFTVGGAGTVDWRKSPDLFVQVAATVFRKKPDARIKFKWKGASEAGVEIKRLKYDVKVLGLENEIVFEPASGDMKEFYASVDLFLLTSREDPYPLVVLEAADANVPTVCFKESGGAIEFIEESEGGMGVDYLNIEAMADAVLFYYDNEQERTAAGARAKSKLSETHQDIQYIAEQFNFISKSLNKKL